MRKISFLAIVLSAFTLTGCSLFGSSGGETGLGMMKSLDQGVSWSFINDTDGEQTLDGVDVYSVAINPEDNKKVFAGTKEVGIFYSKDGGTIWKHLDLSAINVYDVAVDSRDTNNVYAVGVDTNTDRGKIYKSEHEGDEWREVYTEPASGTFVTRIEIDPYDSNIIFAGTIEGDVIKSNDAGESWQSVTSLGDAIVDIVFDSSDSKTVYFAGKSSNLYKTRDGGDTTVQVGHEGDGRINFLFNTLVADPNKGGVLYAGSDAGIHTSIDYGQTWTDLNVIESSEKYPIRAIAVNPVDSDIIVYSSARAIYRSVDGGESWSTKTLKAGGSVRKIIFDPMDENTLYLTLYKVDSGSGLLINI